VNLDQLDRCWPWLVAALKRTGVKHHTYASLRSDLLAGRAMLWPSEHGAVVTECVIEPDARVVRCWLGGGDMKAILAMVPGIEAWGRAMGCNVASVEGRKGWERVFRPLGYVRVGDELRRGL